MSDQSFIQVRLESKLKEEATLILNDIGMDMPNAIRMFLKRIVIERGLPFDTRLPEDSKQLPGELIKNIERRHPTHAKHISMEEYVSMLCRVPAGKVTRYADIVAYFKKIYGAERVEIEFNLLYSNTKWEGIPYWREVSTRGMVQGKRFLCTRKEQQDFLEQEGLTIIPCGAYNKSLKVKDYQEHLFDFDSSAEQGAES